MATAEDMLAIKQRGKPLWVAEEPPPDQKGQCSEMYKTGAQSKEGSLALQVRWEGAFWKDELQEILAGTQATMRAGRREFKRKYGLQVDTDPRVLETFQFESSCLHLSYV